MRETLRSLGVGRALVVIVVVSFVALLLVASYAPAPATRNSAGSTSGVKTQTVPNWVLGAGIPKAMGGRYDAASAYIPGHGFYVYGGISGSGSIYGDMWAYNAGTWTQVCTNATCGPTARWGASLAYMDSDAVLFGGCSSAPGTGLTCSTPLNDTWMMGGCSYPSSSWTQFNQATFAYMATPGYSYFVSDHSAPSPRWDASITSWNNEAVLFGGRTSNTARSSETWLFGQNDCDPPYTWQFTPAGGGPSARSDAGFSTDGGTSSSGSTLSFVLFGGVGSTGTILDDTWVLDPSSGPSWNVGTFTFVPCGCTAAYTMQGQWVASQATSAVSSREAPAFAYQGPGTVGNVLLFGGYTGTGAAKHDTWTWACTSTRGACSTWTWTPAGPLTVPGGRAWAVMGPDSTSTSQAVLFGGLEPSTSFHYGDTWTYS